MRLHHLRLSAFGPFPGTEHVDFDALSEAGLFLLRGETGAGKTSVLDAVCFALYGTLPGIRAGSEKGVRSHYAAPDAVPEVELTFSVRERTFRITRNPEYQRPKLRGTGFTKAQAAVTLSELRGGAWEPLSTRLDEVGQQIGAVLGMDVHQFTRVAMLPQGEFAAFLRSDDRDREKLLKRLFDTALFDRTTAAAAARHRELSARAGTDQDMRTALAQDAQRLADERLGAPDVAEALAAAPGALAGDAAWFDAVAALASARRTEADAAAGAAQGALGLATAAHAGAVRTAEDAAALRAYEERVAAAEGEAEAARERAERWAMHRRAVAVRSEVDAHAQALERAGEAAERLAAAAEATAAVPELTLLAEGESPQDWGDLTRVLRDHAAEAAGAASGESGPGSVAGGGPREAGAARGDGTDGTDDAGGTGGTGGAGGAAGAPDEAATAATAAAPGRVPGESGASFDDAVARVERWRQATHGAQEAAAQALKAEERTASARGVAAAASAALSAAVEERERTAAALALAHEHARAATAALSALPERPGAVEEATLEEQRLSSVVEAAKQAEKARAALATAAEAQRAADLARVEARDAAYALRLRRDEAMAGVLAGTLEDGVACLVCGSIEHPAPADQDGLEEVSREAIAAADATVTAREEAHTRAASAHEAKRVTLESLQASAEGLGVEAASAAHAAARALLVGAQEAVSRRAAAEAEATAAGQGLQLADAAHLRAQADVTKAEGGLQAATEAVLEAERAAEGAAAGHPDVAARRAATAAWAGVLERAATALEALQGATQALTLARDRATAALAQAGLDRDQAREAVLPAAEAAALERAVQARAALEAALAEAGASEAIARAKRVRETGLPVPDDEELARLAAGVAEAEGAKEAAAASATLAGQLVGDLATRRGVIEELDARLGPLRRALEVAKTIADLTSGNGENRLNMSLSTYVLAARLEAVADAATLRLDAMSDGRYRLVHVDEKQGNRRSGLGLAVEDAWTGTRRGPQTLSGGETFMASLALALGLADVVQEESGGVDVETLFVDEGFGTLDPETLELVLDGLDQLRRGGRLVGVVSHVAELGQRIGAQIRVEKSRQGSRLSLSGVGEEA